jgi:hypothetical protein
MEEERNFEGKNEDKPDIVEDYPSESAVYLSRMGAAE